MRIFYFMGRNAKNRSGVSWKVWKISRIARTVTVWFGPVTLENRRPVPVGKLTECPRSFRTLVEAKAFEASRVASKLAKGYERRTRWR